MFFRGSNATSQADVPSPINSTSSSQADVPSPINSTSSSVNNSITVAGGEFQSNYGGRGGGAILGLAFEDAADNDLVISNCSIKSNSGENGGGLTVLVSLFD